MENALFDAHGVYLLNNASSGASREYAPFIHALTAILAASKFAARLEARIQIADNFALVADSPRQNDQRLQGILSPIKLNETKSTRLAGYPIEAHDDALDWADAREGFVYLKFGGLHG